MAENRRPRRAPATFLSCSIALPITALAGGLAGSTAYAQTANPAPPASSPAPPQAAAATFMPVPAPDAFQARNQVGVQVGSTGIFQFVYRLRALGPLHLEAGGFGADHGGNVSAGVLVGVPMAHRWFPYVGFGGGAMWAFGPKTVDGCDPKTTDCPTVTDSDTLLFLYARVGIGVALGNQRRHLLSVDVGGWRGNHEADRTDAAGVGTKTTTAVLTPMAGLSYFYPF